MRGALHFAAVTAAALAMSGASPQEAVAHEGLPDGAIPTEASPGSIGKIGINPLLVGAEKTPHHQSDNNVVASEGIANEDLIDPNGEPITDTLVRRFVTSTERDLLYTKSNCLRSITFKILSPDQVNIEYRKRKDPSNADLIINPDNTGPVAFANVSDGSCSFVIGDTPLKDLYYLGTLVRHEASHLLLMKKFIQKPLENDPWHSGNERSVMAVNGSENADVATIHRLTTDTIKHTSTRARAKLAERALREYHPPTKEFDEDGYAISCRNPRLKRFKLGETIKCIVENSTGDVVMAQYEVPLRGIRTKNGKPKVATVTRYYTPADRARIMGGKATAKSASQTTAQSLHEFPLK